LCRLIEVFDFEIDTFGRLVAGHLARHPGYLAILVIPGVGPTLAAIFVAEIGDVGRFPSARHLCSWAGLTPRHRESDTTVHRGPITKPFMDDLRRCRPQKHPVMDQKAPAHLSPDGGARGFFVTPTAGGRSASSSPLTGSGKRGDVEAQSARRCRADALTGGSGARAALRASARTPTRGRRRGRSFCSACTTG
jgi:hypothetical protein